jgi:tight adherence protein C
MNLGAVVIPGAVAAAAVVLAGARFGAPSARQLPSRRTDENAERRPNRPLTIAAVVVVAAAAAAALGATSTAVLGGLTLAAVTWRRRTRAAAARRAIEAAMPAAVELMVVCLHAGLTPTQAIVEVAGLAPVAVRPGFAAVEQRLHRGAGFADALVELTGHCGRSALPLVSALATAVRDGLPLAPVLDRLTDEANASRRRAGEGAARRLPGRLSFPLVLCTLPSFVLLAIAPAVLGALSTVRGSAP